ncbi:glycosyltransferase [Planococcus sp. MERTA32b]|nr:glycosyltransferase [Planococcus sp. MER TA 32b]
MKKIYIGSFPPPYGGVTIKNKMLYDNLSKYILIEKLNLGSVKNFKFKSVKDLLMSIMLPNKILIIGASGKYRKLLTRILFYFNKKTLKRSLLIVMGGVASKEIASNPKYLKWASEYKQIYVETEGMKYELTQQGLNNISIFPNCREKPSEVLFRENVKSDLKLLFFSQISTEKGADIVLDAAKKLNKENIPFEIDFYGHIEPNYREQFLSNVNLLPNVQYHGVFQPETENLYTKLQEYDLLLFPSKWKAEGVPGILVEAKMVALPAIVSDLNYNAEIIEHKLDGIVLKENTPFQLATSIYELHMDRNLLKKMSSMALYSSKKYLLDNYLFDIISKITK